MADRIEDLAASVDRLERLVASIDSRLSAVELNRGVISDAVEDETLDTDSISSGDSSGQSGMIVGLGELGRSLLVLAGAFLLRALTDMQTLPHSMGVALGLVYSLLWIFFADRAGARGRSRSAAFHGVSAALIAFPLLWETTASFGLLSPTNAALSLGILTAFALFVAARRGLQLLAWIFALGAVSTAVALIFATGAMELFTLLLLALGFATLWFGYTHSWHGLRWFTGIAVDLMVLQMTVIVTNPRGIPEHYAGLSPGVAVGLALALPTAYVGSFAFRTLMRGRSISPFGVGQSFLSLLLGIGGTIRIAAACGVHLLALGIVLLLLAAAAYYAAFVFVKRRLGKGANFYYFSSMALGLTLVGSWLALGGFALGASWFALALAAAYLGGRFDRITLRTHCALLVFAVGLQVGLTRAGIAAFIGPSGDGSPLTTPLGLILLVEGAIAYLILIRTRGGDESEWPTRLPRFVVAVHAVLWMGGAIVVFVQRALMELGLSTRESALAAAVRTVVIAAAAVGLAAVGRRNSLRELSWLVYPLLLGGGIKLLVQDLRACPPSYLFVSFICFGIALIAAPRIQRGTDN